MGLPRSTYYDAPAMEADEARIVAGISAICDEFETYGYRRVGAELRHQGLVVNAKKIRRLMREYELQPKRRRRFMATTDSDHSYPIFPNLANDMAIDGPNQLWVADITLSRSSPASCTWRRSWTPGRAAWLATRSVGQSTRVSPWRR